MPSQCRQCGSRRSKDGACIRCVCKHCGKNNRIRARGLCSECYKNADIRSQYGRRLESHGRGEPTEEEVERIIAEQMALPLPWWWDHETKRMRMEEEA